MDAKRSVTRDMHSRGEESATNCHSPLFVADRPLFASSLLAAYDTRHRFAISSSSDAEGCDCVCVPSAMGREGVKKCTSADE